MSQSAPTYLTPLPSTPPLFVAGASGNDTQAECAVRRAGNLVRLEFSGPMDFAPNEAIILARALARLAVECGYRDGDELARVAEYWRQLAIHCGWTDLEEDDGR